MQKYYFHSMAKNASTPALFFQNTRLVYAILFVFGFLLYANTLSHQTALDDYAVIETNTYVQQGFGGIHKIFTTFYWKGSPSFANSNSGIYRPLSLTVFAINWAFTTGKTVQEHAWAAARLGHLQNVLLYACIAILLFRVLVRMLRNYSALLPFIITLLFIAHPLHTEVVANVKSMDELLSFLFSLLALETAFRWYEKPGNRLLLNSAGWLLLALLAKEGAVLFLFVVPLALYFFTDVPRNNLVRISFILLSAVLIWLGLHTAIIQGDASPKITYTFNDNTLVLADGLGERLASAFRIFGRYLALIAFPYPLSYDYSFNDNPITGFADFGVWLTLAVCGALLFVAFRQWKQRTVLSFGILFFFLTFALTCNVFFLIGTTMAERLTFTPLLGICMAAGWLIFRYTGAWKTAAGKLHSTSLLVTAVLVLPYSIMTINRNADWKNNTTLMTADAQTETGSARIYYNYGTLIINRVAPNAPEQQRFAAADSALAAFGKTLEIDSTYAQAWFQTGVCHYRRNEFAKAAQAFYKARRIDPRQDVDRNLADALHSSKQYDSAAAVLKRVIRRNDASPSATAKLAESLLNLKDTAAAIETLEQGIVSNAFYSGNYLLLGNIYGIRKQYPQSREVLEKALQVEPDNMQIVQALALTLQFMGDTKRLAELEAKYLKK
jgi:protein O-mannosyl-transferase